jgi:hypothetical protein
MTNGLLAVNIGLALRKTCGKTNIIKEIIENSGKIKVIGQTFLSYPYPTLFLTHTSNYNI